MGNGILPGDLPSLPKLPSFPKLPDIDIPGFPGGDDKKLPPLDLPEKPGDSVQYPEDADATLRKLAAAVGLLPEVGEKLDYVKKMLGDFGKVQRIADTWARDATMNDAKLEIDQARQDLTGYWEGVAFNAFNTHAINTSGVHNTNQSVLQGLGNSLTSCLTAIFEAYKSGLTLIFNTAADALALGVVGGLTSIGVFTSTDAAHKAVELLQNLIKNIGGVVNGVITTVRALKDQSVYLTGLATQFQNLPESPRQTSVPGLWEVKPTDA